MMIAYIRLVLYGLVGGLALGRSAVAGQFQFERWYIDTNYGGNGKPGWVRAGDMDADGDIDIVAGGGRALFVYEHRDGDWVRHGNLDSTKRMG